MLDQWPPKDPAEVKDYDINWLPELGTDTIVSSVWAIVAGTGLVINSNQFSTTRTKVWLSGGTLGQTYLLKNTITTALGDTEVETATLGIKANPAIVVEDGTGLPNANSYASAATLMTYCNDRGITLAAGNINAALIRATQYIEGNYRNRWPGSRTKYRGLQSLSWPRFGAFVDDGYALGIGYNILPNEIPIELIQATCEAAIRELIEPGYLQPDLTLTNIKRERAGDTEFEYFQGRGSVPLITVINGILAPILMTGIQLFGTTERTT